MDPHVAIVLIITAETFYGIAICLNPFIYQRMKKKAQQEITAFTLLYFLLQYNMPVRHVIRCGFLVGAYKISKLTNILFLSWTLERQAPRAVCLLPFIPTDRL